MPNNFLTLVIQARMNSTRFPNKVMSDLSGAPFKVDIKKNRINDFIKDYL